MPEKLLGILVFKGVSFLGTLFCVSRPWKRQLACTSVCTPKFNNPKINFDRFTLWELVTKNSLVLSSILDL